MSEITEFNDYRTACRALLTTLKAGDRGRYSFAGLASSCQVQPSYLSAVLKGRGHLNRDQLYRAMQYLGVHGRDASFLELLHDYQRTSFADRRAEIESVIATRRQQARELSHKLQGEDVGQSGDNWSAYFLEPKLQMVHLGLMIDVYRANPDQLCTSLNLDQEEFDAHLRTLRELGLVELDADGYRIADDPIHLSDKSPLFHGYRKAMRAQAMMASAGQSLMQASALFTADAATADWLRGEMAELLRRAQERTSTATSENLYQITTDLVRWLPRTAPSESAKE